MFTHMLKIDPSHKRIGYSLLIRSNASILPFEVLWAKYRNNGRQDITATLNGAVNGGKTYFNQSSQELIPNGSTVTEKGRIRDRSSGPLYARANSSVVRTFRQPFPRDYTVYSPLKTERNPIFFRGKARGLFQVKFDDGIYSLSLSIRTSFKYSGRI